MRKPARLGWMAAVALWGGCGGSSGYEPGEERAGGDTTAFDTSQDAFTQPASNLTPEDVGTFKVGNNFNGDNWVVAPASTAQRDGLGPVYNATSCSACHQRDGRGRPPEAGEPMFSSLVRLSIPGADAHGGPRPEPHYGGQLQPQGVLGVPGEGVARQVWKEIPGKFADGTAYSLREPTLKISELSVGPMHDDTMFSVRVAPSQYGMGLLEAISEADLLAHADPDDADGDGISGRINHVWDAVHGKKAIGRLGWKANVPSVRQQTAGALSGDIGITSSIFPDTDCAQGQAECAAAPSGGDPEMEKSIFEAMVFYGRTLAVPARRKYRDPTVLKGKSLFGVAGCSDCHVPSFTTSDDPLDVLSGQLIFPYTDLLLHDMGEGLADHRPDYEASGSEWRTAPLWGIGLVKTVNEHQFFLHDGRARGFAEAILWHGGEGEAARDSFRAMSRQEREALIAFLKSM